MIVVSKPSKAIRAPIVWNRPTAGMFDYHYDLAGLYYQVVVIAMNAKTMVKETDTSPSSRWSTTVKSERRVEHGGWSTCQIALSPTLTREPSEMFFLPLVFGSKETTLNCDIFSLSLTQKKPCLITAHAVLMKATMTSSWRWCTNAGWRTRTPNQVNLQIAHVFVVFPSGHILLLPESPAWLTFFC